MLRKISPLPFLALFLAVFTFPVFTVAAEFSLTKIGALDLEGHTYPEWWYTGVKPVLYGTGESGGTVNIKVGDDTNTASVGSDGTWSYASGLDKGDYSIVLSQGSYSYDFVLHLGQALPENISGATSQSSQSTSGVPQTGFNQIAGIAFGLGIALLASYFYISGDSDKRFLFEKKLLKED